MPQQTPGYAPPAPPPPSPGLQPQMQYPAAAPQSYPPVAAPRKLPWDKIGIGCGGMFLGLLCGILSTVGVQQVAPMLSSTTTAPTTAPTSAPAPATPPPAPATPPRKPEPPPTKPGGMSDAGSYLLIAFNPAPGDPATALVATRVNARVIARGDVLLVLAD